MEISKHSRSSISQFLGQYTASLYKIFRQCSENCFMSNFSSHASNIFCSIEEIGVTKHSSGIF